MIRKGGSLGFTAATDNGYNDMKERVMEELKRTFRPEFLNRVDDLIVFHPLEESEIDQIVTLLAADLAKRLNEYGLTFELTEEAKAFLAKEGFDPQYGARPLKRAMQRHIEDKLSESLLSGSVAKGDAVKIDIAPGGGLSVERLDSAVVKS